MEDDRIWILFARRVSGEIAPEECEELKALMKDQPDRGHSMETILEYFESGRKAWERDDAERALRLWPRLKAAMHKSSVA